MSYVRSHSRRYNRLKKACIAGSIAACVYPIPEWIAKECEKRLTSDLLKIMKDFEKYVYNANLANHIYEILKIAQ